MIKLAFSGDRQMTPKAGHIYLGIGGWTFEPWRGVFYPKGLAHTKELRLCERAPDIDRSQRHVLPVANARDFQEMGK